jgi:hypothetical protein
MRPRVALVAVIASVALVACGSRDEPLTFPSEAQGRLLTPTPSAAPDTPAVTLPEEGCPAGVPRMCQEAATAGDALLQANMEAIFTLSRPTSIGCGSVDEERYPQCDGKGDPTLEGFVVSGSDEATFVAPEKNNRRTLNFRVEGLDPEYSDDYGTGEYRILGLATCEPDVRYQLVYLVGLSDPTSTLPGDRFFGTLELTEQDRGWAISRLTLDILSNWQLHYDDPLTDAGCGKIEPWRT